MSLANDMNDWWGAGVSVDDDWIAKERCQAMGECGDSPFYHLQGSARRPVTMKQPAYFKEHRDIVKLLDTTGRSLMKEARDQAEEAAAMKRKLRGGEFNSGHLEMLGRLGQALYGDVTPEKVAGTVLDSVQDFFKSPEQLAQEKRQKEEEELAEEQKKQRESGKWSSWLFGNGTPFYHMRGGLISPELETRTQRVLARLNSLPNRSHLDDIVSEITELRYDLREAPEGGRGEEYFRDILEYALDQAERINGSLLPDQIRTIYQQILQERNQGAKLSPRGGRPAGNGKPPVLPPQDALESKKDNPMVEEVIEEPMDDGDIRTYFPNAKIIRYSSLAKLSDIEQLLPKDKSYAFLLYEDSPGSGHWVVLLRYGNTIEFFCSYGSKIDGPLRWYNPKDNAMLGQSKPYLSLLLKKAGKRFKAIHNPVAFQSSKQGVATCGAWDVMRVNQLVNHNQDLHDFIDYMEDVKKETGLTYDEIVVNYVSKR